jgi:hypothetical protein
MPLNETQDFERLFEQALGKRTALEVWAHLSPLRARLSEREVALAYMTLAQASPRDKALPADAATVVAAHASDAEVLIAALTALIRRQDAAGIDALVEIARELEAGLQAAERLADVPQPLRAPLAAAIGNARARLRPEDETALPPLEEAVKLDPDGPWLSDLVLVHKRARRFRAALVVARNAVKRHGPKKPLLVELALVALGAGEANEAAEALRGLGLTVEPGQDALPFVPDLLPVAVRVPSKAPGHGILRMQSSELGLGKGVEGAFETVWVQPLSPMHGVVRSATFREAVTDFGDVILFDVAPLGMLARPQPTELAPPESPSEPAQNAASGHAPLLAFLGVLKAGDERRLRFLALEQEAGQVLSLFAALPSGALPLVHSTSVEKVCPRCMAGETLVRHEHLPPEDQRFVIGKLVVPASLDLAAVAAALESKKKSTPGVLLAMPAMYELLGRTAEAGKHHKTWGAIERGLGAKRP